VCSGVREEDVRATATATATPASAATATALRTGFSSLVRRARSGTSAAAGGESHGRGQLVFPGQDESRAVSAKLELVGGAPIFWSSACSNVLEATSSSSSSSLGGAARRCGECSRYLASVFLPRGREAAAAAGAAAAATATDCGGVGSSSSKEEKPVATPWKVRPFLVGALLWLCVIRANGSRKCSQGLVLFRLLATV